MIITVTLNPALDVTYTVDALVPHATNRVTSVVERAGGKGLNVAHVLHALGEPVLATGLLGGATGAAIGGLIDADGAFVPIAGESRRTVTVVDGRDATGLLEPGPVVSGAEWAAFRRHFAELLGAAEVVALCGSLPRGLPPDAYAELIRLARERGVRTVLDTSGPALVHGAAAGPDVAKPNAEELPGEPGTLGAGAVVVSHGPKGLIAYTADSTWSADPPAAVVGNPTGAGDACVAALARGLRTRVGWPELLADAVALSAASVHSPIAGAFDLHHYRDLRPRVAVSRL